MILGGEFMDFRKAVLRDTGIIALGEAIGVAVMFGVFLLLGRFDRTVLLGGLCGATLAILNFLFMAINASIASERAVKQDVRGGQMLMQTSYIMRFVVIFLVLFILVKSGLCNPFAAVIPLLFTRPTITLAEFFRKPGERS